MKIELAYGRNGLTVDLPEPCDVIEPHPVPGLADERAALLGALRHPLGCPALAELVKPGMRVVVAHSDITRATPNERILPVILAELEGAGVRREDITLLNALGTHRRHTEAEMRALLGDDLYNNYRCLQHDPHDAENLISLGVTCFNHPVRLNRLLVEADFKILTGFIEPHLFAGFSGGPKCVLPGLAGAESVLTNHGLDMVGHPNANFGITEGNPLWEEMMEMALRLSNVFLLNVTMNRQRQITGVFAGDLRTAHRAGCEFARQSVMVKVGAPYDVVVTTNSGYPLDQNLYQTSKGMRAAQRVVRRGGAILMAAACEDGIPNDGNYARLIAQAGSLQGLHEMLAQPGFAAEDQWQLQIQAMLQDWADVYVYSDGLSDEQIRTALFIPCRDIDRTVRELQAKYGPRLCVLPEGPQVIAYVE
ncbi:MAG: nickel-dependent lactate racemase [Anaerolineales bacterium]